jgi:hypothetical protein
VEHVNQRIVDQLDEQSALFVCQIQLRSGESNFKVITARQQKRMDVLTDKITSIHKS